MDITFPKESDVKAGRPFVIVSNDGFELNLMHLPYYWDILKAYMYNHKISSYFSDITKFLYTGVIIKIMGKAVSVYIETNKDTPVILLGDYDNADKAEFSLVLDALANILRNELQAIEAKNCSKGI